MLYHLFVCYMKLWNIWYVNSGVLTSVAILQDELKPSLVVTRGSNKLLRHFLEWNYRNCLFGHLRSTACFPLSWNGFPLFHDNRFMLPLRDTTQPLSVHVLWPWCLSLRAAPSQERSGRRRDVEHSGSGKHHHNGLRSQTKYSLLLP